MTAIAATGAPPPSLPERFAGLAAVLKGLLFRYWPNQAHDPARNALFFFANAWLNRTVRRFERLVAAAQAGTLSDLPPRKPRPAPKTPLPETPPRTASDKPRMPTRVGWLFDTLPAAIPYLGQLGHFLADAELEALMRQAPNRFGRVLRPLCRALRLVPPAPATREILRLPSAQDPKPPPRPRRPRVRKPRTDLIDMHDGRFFTPAQFRRHLGLPSRKPWD